MKKPITNKEWKIKEAVRAERIRTAKTGAKSVTLPKLSWQGDEDGRVPEQKTNG